MLGGLIFHVCRKDEWGAAKKAGRYQGSSPDKGDGFIHFSTAEQIARSAVKHLAGQENLVLLAVDPARLGTRLRWEPSRDHGGLFPHLYGALPVDAVVAVHELPLDENGSHVFPEGIVPQGAGD